jgi:hypothetical protein
MADQAPPADDQLPPAPPADDPQDAPSDDEDEDTHQPVFRLVPGQASRFLNYDENPADSKLFHKAILQLDDEKFALNHENLRTFLDQLADRSDIYGWDTILELPYKGNENDLRSLLTNYGEFTIEEVKTYAKNHWIGQHIRVAQDSVMLYHCLKNSITKSALNKLQSYKKHFIIHGQGDGVVLLKAITDASHIRARATASVIRNKLAALDQLMVDKNYNVGEFMDEVDAMVLELAAQGESSSDMMNNLMRGLRASTDQKFVQYVETKYEKWEEGEDTTWQDISRLAVEKWKSMTVSKQYNKRSKEEEEIIALKATLEQVQTELKKTKSNQQQQKNNPSNKQKSWRTTPPKKGESNKKTVNGETYWWCKGHKKWMTHTTNDCKKLKAQKAKKEDKTKATSSTGTTDESTTTPNDDTTSTNAKKQLRLTKALAAISED